MLAISNSKLSSLGLASEFPTKGAGRHIRFSTIPGAHLKPSYGNGEAWGLYNDLRTPVRAEASGLKRYWFAQASLCRGYVNDSESFLRKQAWDYFTVHASQRVTTFNFYLVIASLLSTAYFSSFKLDSNLQSARTGLAVLLVCFSFIFWKLDKRNRFFIKAAESALRIFEANEETANPQTKLFTQEAAAVRTPIKVTSPVKTFLKRDFSYSDCFNLVFLGFASIGVVDICWELFRAACYILKSGS